MVCDGLTDGERFFTSAVTTPLASSPSELSVGTQLKSIFLKSKKCGLFNLSPSVGNRKRLPQPPLPFWGGDASVGPLVRPSDPDRTAGRTQGGMAEHEGAGSGFRVSWYVPSASRRKLLKFPGDGARQSLLHSGVGPIHGTTEG
ncbi:hypothetical protein HPP92_028943 [Vanilla planifolia]|uniref:Uncharacterized protein n=1 Tax=Vanilla planifolia TaxID=51239 RepID=A0A835P3K0_VANPL|nr:hypothetical protein HPP92_028933 [Vanilla planifolia]KAG0446240.1 hypothetical protein HPP92_028943 [Vanilla planifolia]